MPLSSGSFGTIPFIVPEFLGLEFSYEYPFAEISRIGQAPNLHRVADALQEITLTLRLDTNYNLSANDKINQLINFAQQRTRAVLTVAGSAKGNFVIVKISWSVKIAAGNGTPISIDANVTFKESP